MMVDRFRALRGGGGGGTSTESDRLLMEAEPDLSNHLSNLLTWISVATGVAPLIVQSDKKLTLPKLLLSSVVCSLCGAFVVLLFVPILYIAVAGGLACGYLPVLWLSICRQRRLSNFNKALPDAIDMMSRSLRAGHSMVAAISIVSEHAAEPVKSEFGEVFRQQSFGLPFRDALMQLLQRIPSSDLRVLVTGMLVQKDTGGNLAEIMGPHRGGDPREVEDPGGDSDAYRARAA